MRIGIIQISIQSAPKEKKSSPILFLGGGGHQHITSSVLQMVQIQWCKPLGKSINLWKNPEKLEGGTMRRNIRLRLKSNKETNQI